MLNGELVERHVVIECIDHPVAVRPDAAVIIQMKSMSVTVAGGIEPVAGTVFTVVAGIEERIDNFFVGIPGGVVEKGFYFRDCWWKSTGIQAESADQGAPVSLLSG